MAKSKFSGLGALEVDRTAPSSSKRPWLKKISFCICLLFVGVLAFGCITIVDLALVAFAPAPQNYSSMFVRPSAAFLSERRADQVYHLNPWNWSNPRNPIASTWRPLPAFGANRSCYQFPDDFVRFKNTNYYLTRMKSGSGVTVSKQLGDTSHLVWSVELDHLSYDLEPLSPVTLGNDSFLVVRNDKLNRLLDVGSGGVVEIGFQGMISGLTEAGQFYTYNFTRGEVRKFQIRRDGTVESLWTTTSVASSQYCAVGLIGASADMGIGIWDPGRCAKTRYALDVNTGKNLNWTGSWMDSYISLSPAEILEGRAYIVCGRLDTAQLFKIDLKSGELLSRVILKSKSEYIRRCGIRADAFIFIYCIDNSGDKDQLFLFTVDSDAMTLVSRHTKIGGPDAYYHWIGAGGGLLAQSGGSVLAYDIRSGRKWSVGSAYPPIVDYIPYTGGASSQQRFFPRPLDSQNSLMVVDRRSLYLFKIEPNIEEEEGASEWDNLATTFTMAGVLLSCLTWGCVKKIKPSKEFNGDLDRPRMGVLPSPGDSSVPYALYSLGRSKQCAILILKAFAAVISVTVLLDCFHQMNQFEVMTEPTHFRETYLKDAVSCSAGTPGKLEAYWQCMCGPTTCDMEICHASCSKWQACGSCDYDFYEYSCSCSTAQLNCSGSLANFADSPGLSAAASSTIGLFHEKMEYLSTAMLASLALAGVCVLNQLLYILCCSDGLTSVNPKLTGRISIALTVAAVLCQLFLMLLVDAGFTPLSRFADNLDGCDFLTDKDIIKLDSNLLLFLQGFLVVQFAAPLLNVVSVIDDVIFPCCC